MYCNNVNPWGKSDDRFWKIEFILGIIKLNTITDNNKSTTNFTWKIENRSSLVIYSIQQMTSDKAKQK